MNIFCKIVNYIDRIKKIKQIEHELSQYSNRELQDMGISRGDIYRIARETE